LILPAANLGNYLESLTELGDVQRRKCRRVQAWARPSRSYPVPVNGEEDHASTPINLPPMSASRAGDPVFRLRPEFRCDQKLLRTRTVLPSTDGSIDRRQEPRGQAARLGRT
jgi:hypothetical protein